MVRTQSFTPSKHRPIGNGANQSKKVRRNTIGRSVPDRTVAVLELPGRAALVDDRLLLHLQWRSGRCQGTLITDTRRRPDRSVRNARTTPSTSCHGDLSRRYDRCYVFAEPLDHEGEGPRSGIIRSKLGNKRELQLFGRDACSPRPGNLCRHICCEHRNRHRRRWHTTDAASAGGAGNRCRRNADAVDLQVDRAAFGGQDAGMAPGLRHDCNRRSHLCH